MRIPIRIRLALTYCAVFCVLIAALEAAAYWSVREAIHSIVDRELETRVAGLEDHIGRHLQRYGWPQLGASLSERPAFQPDYLFVRRTGGEVVFDRTWAHQVPVPDSSAVPQVATLEGPGHALRVITTRKIFGGTPYDVSCATDLWIPATILRRLWLWMILSVPAVLLLASAAGYWIGGRALRPVSGIISAAKSIDSNSLADRIRVPDTGDEIQSLAETMNGMLERIEDGFRQVRQFTDNASHELRTPIAIIRAAAEVALLKPASLKASTEERGYREALHRILRQAEGSTKLIEEMMELARVDSNTEKPGLVPLDVVRSLSHACAEMSALAAAKRLKLTFRTSQPEVSVQGDEERLRRLWLILLDNAVKYTPDGGSITVLVHCPDGKPVCDISDTGIGIAPEHLGRIFERFYRIDKARSRAEGGAGLGLAIASEIAKVHHAVIDATSTPGHGSNFRVTFP